MNCDTAFDLMTDAAGSRSGALAQHFETCTRCRQMQETLAPALEFLMQDEPSYDFSSSSRDSATSDAGSLQPFVTVDSIKIAQQAANRLTAQADLPRVRRQRLAGQLTRYAAAFAAGLLLAFVLFSDRNAEKLVPVGECTRQAAAASSRRSAEAIEALAQSCAVCHTSATTHDKKTSLFRSERATSWDWLAPFFREERSPLDDSRCIAGVKRSTGLNVICQRAQVLFAAKEMTG
jgi:mono/diheme cytochrome c family protein